MRNIKVINDYRECIKTNLNRLEVIDPEMATELEYEYNKMIEGFEISDECYDHLSGHGILTTKGVLMAFHTLIAAVHTVLESRGDQNEK